MLNPFSLSLSLSLSHSPQIPSPSLSFVQNLSFFLWSFLAPNQFSLLQSLPICLLSLMVPPIYHSKHQIPSLYIGATSFKPLSFRRSHPPPTLSLLRTTPPNPSFYGNPYVMKMIIFTVISVMKTKTILFAIIFIMKADDFVRNNLYNENKDNYSTFFEVCFPLTNMRFLSMVLLVLLLFIVRDWYSKFVRF